MKLLKFLIIPFFLTLGYLTLVTYPYFSSKINRYDSLGLLSLVEEKVLNIKESGKADNHLVKGEKITGKFKATENNLGIVLIKFTRFGKVSDQVLFRLKGEGDIWYYENKYRAEEFQNNQYFTFGFPPITNSKNNNYIFEVESLSGTYNNGVGLSLDEPHVALAHKYTGDDLQNINTFFPFIFKKFVYVAGNVNFLKNWEFHAAFVSFIFFVLLIEKKKITLSSIVRFFPNSKKNHGQSFKQIVRKITSTYFLQKKKIVYISKKSTRWFTPHHNAPFVRTWVRGKSAKRNPQCPDRKVVGAGFTSINFYLLLLNTNTKKRILIGLLIFLLALTYRFSASIVHQEGVTLFYAGLGGQGDYDQFIRAATCAVRNFCSAILGQNFLFESSILGIFYEIFGFTGGLKAYLYLMLILSSIVATLPYFLLSRKGWITIGGIIGSIFLATSDFLTHISLNFPPDNGSLFTFSMFFIVYLLTLHIGTIRWLLFFGLIGIIDGLNKALFLINDLAAFAIFAPVFFYEKVKSAIGGSTSGWKRFALIFRKKNIKILLSSLIPLFVFLFIYISWEYFVYIKFSANYFLRGLLLSGGASYISYTSFNDSSLGGNILLELFYLSISAIVMLKRLLDYIDIGIIFLAPILFGLLFFTSIKSKFSVKKFILVIIFSIAVIALLTLTKNNYFKIHEVFSGEYIIDTWTNQIYIKIFLLCEIIILFILNFKYSVIKLTLPIAPYVVMLIILTKNSPFPRLSTHVVAWSIILFAFLIDWIAININKHSTAKIRAISGFLILVLFITLYGLPKMVNMIKQLNSGFVANQNQVKYLRWVEGTLPENAIVLVGGKSDLISVAENVKKPIIYNSLWNAALLITAKEIPGVSPSDFSLISELQNKNNFKKNKYIILEDDIYIWRARITGTGDGVFTTDLNTISALHSNDYSIKVYKYNPTLKKAIYELNIQDTSVN